MVSARAVLCLALLGAAFLVALVAGLMAVPVVLAGGW